MRSGDFGSPMFSRLGKATTVDHVEFHNEPTVQVESTFAKEKRLAALAKREADKEVLDQKTLDAFRQEPALRMNLGPQDIKSK